MIEDLITWRTKRHKPPRDGQDGKDGETTVIYQTDEATVNALRQEVATLKAQALKPTNDQDPIPRAIGDIVNEINKIRQSVHDFGERLNALEQAMDEPITLAAPNSDVSQDDIQHLKSSVEEVGIAALQAVTVTVKRLDALEARMANYKLELTEDMLREIRRA